MAETISGYDILTPYSDPSNQTIQPYSPFSTDDNVYIKKTITDKGNEVEDTTVEEVSEDVNNTEYFNYMANMYAGQYIPVRAQREKYANMYAEKLGIGTRYSANDFKEDIEKNIGPIPEQSAAKNATMFILDSLTGRTPFKGVTGALDVILQATNRALTRDEAYNLQRMERELAIGELAVKQAQEANQNILETESKFYLEQMGYDEKALGEQMGFTSDILTKIAATDLDMQKEKIKASTDLINSLEKTNLTNKPFNVKVKNPETGQYDILPEAVKSVTVRDKNGNLTTQIMSGRIDPNTGLQVFDQPISTDFVVVGGSNVGSESKILSEESPKINLIREKTGEYFNLGGQLEDVRMVRNTSMDKVGIKGSVKSIFQEAIASGKDLLSIVNEISGSGAGTSLINSSQAQYEDDKIKFSQSFNSADAQDYEGSNIVQVKVPLIVAGVKVPNKYEIVEVEASVDNIMDESWYRLNFPEAQKYDPSFAQNKVRENFIVYGLARTLKPTGRLNVDDISRASNAVSIYGFTSAEAVMARMEVIEQKMMQAQRQLINTYPEIVQQGGLTAQDLVNLKLDPNNVRFKQYLNTNPEVNKKPPTDQVTPQFDSIEENTDNITISAPEGANTQSLNVNQLFGGGDT
tara:strand:+ start:223 stop:2127 length:1905 start_codon:yes stop_codon:yes gene_type:complete